MARMRTKDGEQRSLRHVRAAQMRARVIRWAIGKSALGTVFLLGALSYAISPDRHLPGHAVWMAMLVVLSTFNVGLGLRTFGRLHRGIAGLWFFGTAAWGLLSTALLKILLRH